MQGVGGALVALGRSRVTGEESFKWWDTLRRSLVMEGFTVTKHTPSGKLCDAWWPSWVGSLPEAPARPCLGLWESCLQGTGLPGWEGPVRNHGAYGSLTVLVLGA